MAGKNPPAGIDRANWLSYFSFHWIQSLLFKGRTSIIIEDDLHELSKNDNVQRLTDLLLKEWTHEVERVQAKARAKGQKPKRPNMYRVLWRCYGLYFSISMVTGITESACKIGEAILLGYIIRFFDNGQPMSQGISYAVGLFIITIFHGTMHHHYYFPAMRVGFWTRISFISLMYRKCLALSTSSTISTGTIVNLISNDVQPIENAAPFCLFAIIGPLETIVVMYFLWREIGVASFAGLLTFALLVPLQTFFSRYFGVLRNKTVEARDERIRTLSDVFQGIELVKLCAWEVPLQAKVEMLRSIELKYIWRANMMRAANMGIYFFFQPLIALFVFVTFWLQGREMTADKVFVSLTLFNVIRLTMTSFFPKSIETIAEARISIRRITDFLLLPELHGLENPFATKTATATSGHENNDGKEKSSPSDPSVLVEMNNASFSWTIDTEEDGEKNEILEMSKEARRREAEEKLKKAKKTRLSDLPPGDSEQEIKHGAMEAPTVDDGDMVNNYQRKNILNNITMTLRRDELLAIVGPVGCGKSSFCMALLEEMPVAGGSMRVGKTALTERSAMAENNNNNNNNTRPRLSYSAQSPWIFAGSIRNNILFGSEYNKSRYDRVIQVCELTRDFSLFPQGDATIIGEKGVTLSGGQRARVSLARAVYKESDLYILDDPLSAVDPKVGRSLFQNCIKEFLKDKARVLVTHQLQYIQDCDNVLVLEQGEVTHQGRVDEVMRHDVVVETAVEGEDGASIKSVRRKAKFVDVLREFAKNAPQVPDDLEDQDSADKVVEVGGLLVHEDPARVVELAAVRSRDEEDVYDAVPLHRVRSRASTVKRTLSRMEEADEKMEDGDDIHQKQLTVEAVNEGDTSFRVYFDFFCLGSTPVLLFLVVATMLGAQASLVAGDFFLSKWSSQSYGEQQKSYYPMVFGFYCLSTVIVTLARSFLFFHSVAASARSIFHKMLDALLRTDIDFFHANPHGRVLNRFSKDMANTDELLPYTFFDSAQILLMLFGSIVVVCIVNPWVLIAIPFLLGAFYGLRAIYIKTARQVKRIDSTTRSPIYSHLSESLDGLSSVRAFSAGERFMQEMIRAQTDNSRAFFMYLGCARWLGFRLDFIAAVFVGITAIACVAVRDSQQAGLVGLAISYVLQLSSELQWAVRQSVEVAILMVSVERMMEYAAVPPEVSPRHVLGPDGQSVVPNNWPVNAKVSFQDMSLTYPRGDGPVLKGITLDFHAGEKIGVVGRTGAGKSSLIGALFRLVESRTSGNTTRGGIMIDGVDISQIGVHDLRERMAIIPQEPFLFRGSLRFNLDPLGLRTDQELWAALEAAELKRMVERLEGKLDAAVDDNGKNFSIGERQLLSLARAVLRRSKLIALDEATANVDLQSDRLIQRSVQQLFSDATVFTIAHRLNTVIGDYDRILVLDQGEVKEFDEPWVLLQKPEGPDAWLRRMVADTGAENEAALRKVAREEWERRQQAGSAAKPSFSQAQDQDSPVSATSSITACM
ncbi:hypothetical protein DFQ27_008995 [Actinomortierella ambigua]|uniref:Uncharacterized protein n=1 Tax=Actinomortierella ambigua TaxID=1343610 RepID=A0A9P6QJH6_9FUNG|nr:hypothetical protein DFQ27_008995 [Actinomortierella ambigua]